MLLTLFAVSCGDVDEDDVVAISDPDDNDACVPDDQHPNCEPTPEPPTPEPPTPEPPTPVLPNFGPPDYLGEGDVDFEGAPTFVIRNDLCPGGGGGTSVVDTSVVITDERSLEVVLESFPTMGRESLADGTIAVSIDTGAMGPDEIIGTAEALRDIGSTAMLNLVYFFNPQLRFYPVDEATDRTAGSRPYEPTPSGEPQTAVLTIDTGLPRESTQGEFTVAFADPDFHIDGFSDSVTGHGPAIADLISHTMNANGAGAEWSFLVQVDATQTKMVNPGQGDIRAFTTTALANTLHAIDDSGLIQRLNVGVVNMSFGAKACDELFRVGEGDASEIVEPVWNWMQQYPELTLVASAGNTRTDSLTYPAAWTLDSSIGGRVISVGALGPAGNRSCYSNYGPWVDVWRTGDEVVIDHPMRNVQQVWSGTSFAAPQVAAEIASGQLNPATAKQPPPPAPSPAEEKQCQ